MWYRLDKIKYAGRQLSITDIRCLSLQVSKKVLSEKMAI